METKIKQDDLIWLCGFISQEADDKYRHEEGVRKKLKEILKQLRASKQNK